MISWKGKLVPSLSTIVSLSVLNNVELCYRGTGTSWSRGGGSVIAAFFLAHNYVSEQFGNYVGYGKSILKIGSTKNISLNIRNFNYRAGNIRHSYRPIATRAGQEYFECT